MMARILAVLGTLATIVAGIYAVIAYHIPRDPKLTDGNLSAAGSLPANRDSTTSSRQFIKQESRGNNSPNIVGDRNVVNQK